MSIRKTQTGQRKSLLAGASVLAAATAMFSAAPVGVALAQDAAEEDEAIVVTGTRIARRDAVAESPILTVGQEEMTNSGYVTVEQYLNTLPQVTGSISSQSNNPSSNGRAFIDLRGLGANRNLILMDGRRPMGQAGGGTIVDANVIPAALVERTEIITGGAASTYGADAIAGVVNFIMRDNFEGFAWDGQYRITEQGDGQEWGTDFTVGGNFADGRGNAVMNVSFFERDVMYKGARDFAAQATSATGTFPGGAYTTGANTPSDAALIAAFGAGAGNGGAACNRNGGDAGFGFNPDGSLFCTGVGGGNPLDVVGYTGPASHIATFFFPDRFSYNFEPDNILVLPLERWNVYSRIGLDVNDSFRPYVQAMYTNYNAESQLAPTPAGGFTVPVDNPNTVPVEGNPFIGPQLAALLASRGAVPGDCPTATTGACAPFAFSKRFLALGGRLSSNTHDVWQITVGTEGDLTDTWSYDVYASRGRSTLTEVQNGNVRVPQFQAVLNDPATGVGGACATWNVFGLDAAPAACAAAVGLEAKNLTVVDQTIVEGTVTGNLFSLPAGDVQVAIGAGYRDIFFDFKSDAGLAPGLVAGFNGQLPISGGLDWFDIFGEIYVPLLSNLPGVESLSLTAGYRSSDNSASGVAESWKVNMDWTVTDWLRFRGGIQTAIRAPNVAELFSPQTPNFPDYDGSDPCNITSSFRYGDDGLPGGTGADADNADYAQVTALCEAQAPGVASSTSFNQPASQLQATVGGNPNLDPETSDSYTLGFVLNSPFNTGGFMDSLYLSVDYWNIEMEKVIAAVDAVTILQRCFNRDNGNPGYNPVNQWCDLFIRNQSDGRVENMEQFSQNQAFLETSGVDIVFGLGFDLGGMGSLDFNSISTWVERLESATSTSDPTFDYVGSIGSGTGSAAPEWRHTITGTWANGPVSITGQARFIDEMIHNNLVTDPTASPASNTGVDSVWYFDLRGTFDLTSNLTLRAGVNNVADEEPQLYNPNVQAGTDPSTYDILGRRFFVGFNLRL